MCEICPRCEGIIYCDNGCAHCQGNEADDWDLPTCECDTSHDMVIPPGGLRDGTADMLAAWAEHKRLMGGE